MRYDPIGSEFIAEERTKGLTCDESDIKKAVCK